jgi:hypothetical protein
MTGPPQIKWGKLVGQRCLVVVAAHARRRVLAQGVEAVRALEWALVAALVVGERLHVQVEPVVAPVLVAEMGCSLLSQLRLHGWRRNASGVAVQVLKLPLGDGRNDVTTEAAPAH